MQVLGFYSRIKNYLRQLNVQITSKTNVFYIFNNSSNLQIRIKINTQILIKRYK